MSMDTSFIEEILQYTVIHPLPIFPDSPLLVIGELDVSINVKHVWWKDNKKHYLSNTKLLETGYTK